MSDNVIENVGFLLGLVLFVLVVAALANFGAGQWRGDDDR